MSDFEVPKEVMNIAKFLRNSSKSGLHLRDGVLNGRRVEYFKGKSAINALLKEQGGQKPKASSEEEANDYLLQMVQAGLIVRCDRGKENVHMLHLSPLQEFKRDHYYAWVYEGSQILVILGGIGLVGIVLAGVMFPLWPASLRNGTWYLSIAALGLLGLLFVIAIIRLILYVISLVALPRGFWLFPNLFEDVGFIESFIPLYGWEEPKEPSNSGKAPAAGSADTAATSAAEAAPIEDKKTN
ncbi:Translocation protein S62 [Mycoemilia scoparia]|uniref:Translocation protein SEC62 n=1 Tax=Mycoemilia scoparia TaxID=417184 RepID=A0A9W8A1D8_9FUNG|nr:Translocation protein S62 [Mycoemilia scoparia]